MKPWGTPAEAAGRIRAVRLIAILRAVTAAHVETAAGALYAGGVRVMEVAGGGAGDLEVLRGLARWAPEDVLVGAGTIVTPEVAAKAVERGARFLVSPHLVPTVLEWGVRAGVLVIPGALTPGEIAACRDSGAQLVKLFPASAVGPGYIRALRAPYPWAELIPTGGIGADNIRAYLDAGAVAVAAGGALLDPRGTPPDWTALEARARAFVAAATP